MRGDLTAFHHYLKRRSGDSQMGVGLFSQITNDRTRGNGLKSCWGRFKLDIGEYFYTEGRSAIGTGCPQEWWNHCAWKCSKNVYMWHLGPWFGGGLDSAVLTVGV